MTALRLFAVFWGLALACLPVLAQTPSLMNYQGTLTDDEGVPIEGPHDLTFRLYTAADGGESFWSELRLGVVLEAGLFNVELGTENPLTPAVFDQAVSPFRSMRAPRSRRACASPRFPIHSGPRPPHSQPVLPRHR